MPEQKYFSMLTEYGKAVARDVFNSGETVKLAEFAVGYGMEDTGNGGYTLTPDQADLKNEWLRQELNSLRVDPNNRAWLIAEGIIREDIGGHWINEIAIIDDRGGVIALATWPPTYKPTLPEGSSSAAIIRMVVEVSDTGSFELVIDTSLALLTREEFMASYAELTQTISASKEEIKTWVGQNFIRQGEVNAAELVSVDNNNGLTAETSDRKLFVDKVPRPTNAQAPIISVQPVGGVVTLDGEHTLHVSAYVNDGGQVTVQWYENDVENTETGTPIEGETEQDYVVPTDEAGIKYYYAVVTNTNERATVSITATTTSDIASVNVNVLINAQTPIITVHPASATYNQNAVASALSVTASVSDGGVLIIRWMRNVVNSNEGGVEVGTNSPTFTPNTSQAGTGYYFAEITNTIPDNGDGGVKTATVTSDVAVITVNAQQAYTFGRRWNKTLSSTILQPLYDTIGRSFTPMVNGIGGSSDFDDLPIYRDMRLCVMVNGQVDKYLGEPGFSRNPVVGDLMVQIPLFYVKVLDDNVNRDFLISNVKHDSTWRAAPGFTRPDGSLRPYIYVSAYTLNSEYRSVSGNQSIVNITRAAARAGIRARGVASYYQYDFQALSTIELLYMIEVGNLDSQTAIGKGYTDSTNVAQQNTGATDNIGFHSGSTVDANSPNSAKGFVKYRHIENLWGNIHTWVDGINFNNADTYIATNPDDYADDTTTNYNRLSYTKAAVNGYQKSWGFDPNIPWAQICTDATGADGTYVPDYYYQSTGWRVLLVGGHWTHGAHAGLFCFPSHSTSTSIGTNVGCRLLALP